MSKDNMFLWNKLSSLSALEPFDALTQVFGERGVGWGWNVVKSEIITIGDTSMASAKVNGWYRHNGEIIHCSPSIGCHVEKSFETREDINMLAIRDAVLYSFLSLGLHIDKRISA